MYRSQTIQEQNLKIPSLEKRLWIHSHQGRQPALGKRTLQVSHYDKGTAIQEYIQGLHHVTPGSEQQDFEMNSEAQRQHEESCR